MRELLTQLRAGAGRNLFRVVVPVAAVIWGLGRLQELGEERAAELVELQNDVTAASKESAAAADNLASWREELRAMRTELDSLAGIRELVRAEVADLQRQRAELVDQADDAGAPGVTE